MDEVIDGPMAEAQSPNERLSDEQFAQRGDEIYERTVRPRVAPDDEGKFVAIDVGTDAYEFDASDLAAVTRLRARRPGAPVWLTRVGRKYAYRFGAERRPGPEEALGHPAP